MNARGGDAPAPAAEPVVESERVLVIKHGALGDFVLATGAFAAIRAHHATARIVLLTTQAMQTLAARCPDFDEIWFDSRPGWLSLFAHARLIRRLARARFDRVYDLQTSRRSSRYFRVLRMFGRAPEWSGIARGCSHPHANPERDRLHTVDRLAEQLAAAGIADMPDPSLPWLAEPIERFGLPARFVLLVPGGSPHRPEKRWPMDKYAALARNLLQRGCAPVLVGAAPEQPMTAAIAAKCRGAVDLAGQTSLGEVYALGQSALGAVGNDTGPMHLIAAAGAPSVVLFSRASDPALCAPVGREVAILRREPLSGLSVGEVEAALTLR